MEGREGVMMREKRLYEASLSGDVESLNQLLEEDKLALARVSLTCFNETPLHVASMLGHLEFAKAILSHKPDLVTKLDSQRRSPLHLASANGYVEMVKILLRVDTSMCLAHDVDGRTPLHVAAMKGEIDVLNELAQVNKEVIKYTFDRGETILHLCVIYNRFEALKRLLELCPDDDLVNAKDEHGNTILHTATSLKQMETIKYLLNRNGVRVNVVNANAFTALDITNHIPKDLKSMEIRDLLIEAGAQRGRDVPAPPPQSTVKLPVARPRSRGNRHLVKKQDMINWLEKRRDSLMVASTVIAAMAYQAGVNPPSGVWQEDKEGYHKAGTSILASRLPKWYLLFWVCNTASFVASLSTMFLLISGIPLKKRFIMWILMATMWVTMTFMALTYLASMFATLSDDHPEKWTAMAYIVIISVLVWLALIAIVFIIHTYRILKRIVIKCCGLCRRNGNEVAGQNV
ncbi:ankyrin repeat-containing protein BDA1-like [Cornus florida]|uniref:ankyrin repeat-containing protein BDA1-like n=1 Tax=Cornus florida TaxID=4283 RepID=UPI0028A110AB|nr:ankyrin repeat-containing protein BDA1-like [Cornus florida]